MRISTRSLVLTATCLAAARGALAQQPSSERAAAAAQQQTRGIFIDGSCALKRDNKQVKEGIKGLKDGIQKRKPEEKSRAFEQGKQALIAGITNDGQEQNGAAWYYLGRIYLHRGDLAGSDSALTRAEKLAPDCAEDIGMLRRAAWVPLVNAGIEFDRAGKADSAIVLYRQANTIDRRRPQGLTGLGALYANSGQHDSAVVYFRQAATAAESDTSLSAERNLATFNLGVTLQRLEQHREAIEALERFLKWAPGDVDAKRALTLSYRAVGDTERAQAIDKELVVAAPPGGGDTSKGVASGDVFTIGVNLFNEKKYAEAAEAFGKVVEAEPNNRDALYNQANSYLGAKDGPGVTKAASRLIELEPLNEEGLRLLGQGYRLSGDQSALLKTVERLLGLPTGVEVTSLVRRENGATLSATATGREAKTPAGAPIKPAATTLTFELLDRGGNVVATETVAVPALKAGAKHNITIPAKGTGIAAWRYRAEG